MSVLKSVKRFVLCVFLLLSFFPAFSADFFCDTAAGAAIDILPASKTEKSEVQFRGFCRAQIQIGKRFLANTDISLRSGNIFRNTGLYEIPSFFSINELSLMYRFRIKKTVAQFSFFAGEYETAGSDIFARRYLGAKPFNSYMLEKETGLKSPAILAIDGIGGAFTMKYDIPLANTLYVYYNEKLSREYLNIDMRMAGISNALIADLVFGTSLPIEKRETNGGRGVLTIRRADVHAGFTLLLGDNPFVNLFMQSGIARIQTNPASSEKIFSPSDLYVFFEPRFSAYKVLLSLSMFHLPPSVYKYISYVDYPLGASLLIKSIPFSFKSSQGVFGSIFCVSSVNPLTDAFSVKTLSAQIVPFVEFSVPKGMFKVRLPFKPLEYTNWDKLMSLSVSYKVRL